MSSTLSDDLAQAEASNSPSLAAALRAAIEKGDPEAAAQPAPAPAEAAPVEDADTADSI